MQTSSNLASANSGSMLTGISETHSGSDISSGPILTWTEAEAKGKELMLQLDKALLGNSSDKAASTIKELKGHWVIKNAGTKRSSEFENLNKYSAAFNFDRELIPFLCILLCGGYHPKNSTKLQCIKTLSTRKDDSLLQSTTSEVMGKQSTGPTWRFRSGRKKSLTQQVSNMLFDTT